MQASSSVRETGGKSRPWTSYEPGRIRRAHTQHPTDPLGPVRAVKICVGHGEAMINLAGARVQVTHLRRFRTGQAEE